MVDFLETAETETSIKGGIHLFIDAKDGVSEAVVPVRWCICPAVFRTIRDEKLQNPHLLLVVTQEKREVQRHLIPLSREMTFISFPRPGDYSIQATILSCQDVDFIKKTILEKCGNYNYRQEVLSYDGNISANIRLDIIQLGKGEIGVNVAPGFFAKKPPRWLWDWGNLWYETEPRDQCQFRRRCILAFSIQPVAVSIWYMFFSLSRLFIAALLRYGCGLRGVDFGPVIHVFRNRTKDIWYDLDKSVFLYDKDGMRLPSIFFWFQPIIVISIMLLAYLQIIGLNAFGLSNLRPVILYVFISTFGILLGVILSHIFYYFSCRLFFKIADKVFPPFLERRTEKRIIKAGWVVEKKKRREKEKDEQFKRECDELIWPLVCKQDGEPLKPSIKAISKQRRTIYLRYLDLKARVCKPFAR